MANKATWTGNLHWKKDTKADVEARRSQSISESVLVRRTSAWARTQARRKLNRKKPEFNRLMSWLSGLLGIAVIDDPLDRSCDGMLIITELPIGNRNADAAIPGIGLVVESDEATPNHNAPSAIEPELIRDEEFRQLGWRVLHVKHLDYLFIDDPKAKLAAALASIISQPNQTAQGVIKPLGLKGCECGCGKQIREHKRFFVGHHLRIMSNPKPKGSKQVKL